MLNRIKPSETFPHIQTGSFKRDFSVEKEENIVNSNVIYSLNIQKVRCNCYIEQTPSTCVCGLSPDDHYPTALTNRSFNRKWDSDVSTEDAGLTDAYGDVKFTETFGKQAKYIRLSHHTKMETVLKLLFDYWKLKEPKLLISVTGGAQRFNLKPRLRDVFRRGLIKAASSTNAWISTGGLNVGVMKHVGEAIREYPNEEVVVLGVAPWTMVLNNEKLIRSSNQIEPVEYSSIKDEKIKDKRQPLDSNHTHFLLVDYAKISYGGEIKFRGKLESSISRRGIPIVLLVLEGGPGTIDTVFESIKNNSPCVIIYGSGKCADIIGFSIKYLEETASTTIDGHLEKEIETKIKVIWPDKDPKPIKSKIFQILDAKYSHLLTIYELDGSEKPMDIDVAILSSLLKSKKENHVSQMKLALTWDRVDIARDFIFNEIKLNIDELNAVIYEAILNNRVEFVKLFYENGFRAKSILNYSTLLKLYNDLLNGTKKNELLLKYLLETRNMLVNTRDKAKDVLFKLKDIERVIKHLIGDLYKPEYDEFSIEDKCEYAEHELFMLSILCNRPKLAQVFWKEGDNQICHALIASKLYKRFASDDYEQADELTAIANEFEDLALNILSLSYDDDVSKSENILVSEISEFGGITALQAAVSSQSLKIVGHSCVQGLLSRIWYNHLSPYNLFINIFICLFIPFLAPILLNYKESNEFYRKQAVYSKSNGQIDAAFHESYEKTNPTNEKPSYLRNIYYFYKTPLVKFVYYQAFYVLFLLLFSYVMLCDFFPIPSPIGRSYPLVISAFEVLLIIWVIALLLDKIDQFVMHEFKFSFRNIQYWIDNSIDFLAFGLYFIALILRFIPNTECYRAARIIFCLDLIVWYIKSLAFYYVFRFMGPKLVMIKRMLFELAYFIFIVLVFMFAFGVSTQALLYHNQKLDINLLSNVFFPSYFMIGGEYYTRETIMTSATCEQSNTSQIANFTYSNLYGSSSSDCPDPIGSNVALAIYVGYLIILNILLVNLLIAIFSFTINRIQDETDSIWKFQRYSLVHQYAHKYILPAPLNVLSQIIVLIRLILRPFREKFFSSINNDSKGIKRFVWYLSKDKKSGFKINFNAKAKYSLMKWEKYNTEEYIFNNEMNEKESQNYKINQTQEKVDQVNRKLNELIESRNDYKRQLESCEKNIAKILELLNSRSFDE